MKIFTRSTLITSIFLCFIAAPVKSQSIEQLQQLRAGVATQTTNASATNLGGVNIEGDRQLPTSNGASGSIGQYMSQNRNGLVLPGEATIGSVFPLQEAIANPPFAANLFLGGFETERESGINDNYLIAAGDKISIWLWGAVNYSDVVTVDNQGNIFIPNIGPIKLVDTPAGSVNQLVTSKIKQTYTRDVNVYVNLLTSTPVTVYIAGPVLRPGQYAGQANDSALYFLKRAGGVDFLRGSFRNIDLIRDSKTIATFDLYEFYRYGQLPEVSFKDGDTLLVKPIGNTVTVSAGARNSFTFEFAGPSLLGTNLINYAKPNPFTSHLSVSGVRDIGQYSDYFNLNEIEGAEFFNGDHIEFLDDHETNIYRVKVAGSFLGPSQYMVHKGSRLHDVMRLIAVDPELSDDKNIYLLRESVAIKQKEIIDSALERLERSVYTAPVNSSGEGAIRVQEAQLISDFVARARQIQPLGKVIVSENGETANLLLEPNDTVVIPAVTDVIHVGGEVLMPQSVVFNENAQLEDYVAWAGGFSERADDDRIMIIRANGTVKFEKLDSNLWLGGNQNVKLSKGDQIVVLPKIDAKSLQAIKDITQIIYQIAIAANVALD